jgi:hypothetical protein
VRNQCRSGCCLVFRSSTGLVLSSTVASERAKTTRVIDTSGTCALYRCHASRHSRTTRCRTVRRTRPCRHQTPTPAQWHDGALTVLRGPSCERASPRDSLRKINQTDPSRRQLCVSPLWRKGETLRRCGEALCMWRRCPDHACLESKGNGRCL